MRTASDLLGWEGMRLRVAIKDAKAEAQSLSMRSVRKPDPYDGLEERVEAAVQEAIKNAQHADTATLR